jgi:phage protein D
VASTHIDCTVKLGTDSITGDEVHDILVEADIDQPDHACVILSNASTRWSEKVNEGDEIEIKLGLEGGGSSSNTVFKGEVTGIEPIYDARQPARVVIRALNQMHRLTRGKKSVAHKQVTDKDMVDKVCQTYGLTAKYGDTPPATKYEHVYQHNMTDFEFLKLRASRIGFEILVNDKELNFRKRVEADSGIKLEFGLPGDSTLEKFMPRLSTANQVSEVKVYGWDPDKKKEIVGSAKPQSSKLGDKTGSQVADEKHKNVLQIQVESPVASKEEADNIAKSILQDRLMHFITGDGVCRGNPALRPGIIVSVNVQDKRFNGKYYLTAVKHRYIHAGTAGGYRTEFKFRRDAKTQS